MARPLITPGTRGLATPGAVGQTRGGGLARRTAPGRDPRAGTASQRGPGTAGPGTAGPGRRWVILAGAVVLLRAGRRAILGAAACTTALFVLAAVTVAAYAGSSLPAAGFGSAFNFAEPAVLTQNWAQASVLLATAVTLGLLAAWTGFALAARRWRAAVPIFGACVAAVSLAR